MAVVKLEYMHHGSMYFPFQRNCAQFPMKFILLGHTGLQFRQINDFTPKLCVVLTFCVSVGVSNEQLRCQQKIKQGLVLKPKNFSSQEHQSCHLFGEKHYIIDLLFFFIWQMGTEQLHWINTRCYFCYDTVQ